jgi:predicted nucleic acid-binding protein
MRKVVLDTNVLISGIIASGYSASGIPSPKAVSADPDDDFVLACALEEKVDCVVSGDPHLVSLKTYKHIPILTPKEFVERYSIPHKQIKNRPSFL